MSGRFADGTGAEGQDVARRPAATGTSAMLDEIGLIGSIRFLTLRAVGTARGLEFRI